MLAYLNQFSKLTVYLLLFLVKLSTKKLEDSSLESSLESSQLILKLISENDKITTDGMADVLNISRRAVTKQLSKLKEKGHLKRVGSTKAGKWVIIKR